MGMGFGIAIGIGLVGTVAIDGLWVADNFSTALARGVFYLVFPMLELGAALLKIRISIQVGNQSTLR